MNYYERHLGDYAKDTGHLSMLEHGAYTMLMDRYYSTEQPIPAEQAHRLARAKTEDERAAVDVVLQEFFVLEDGAWKKGRIEEELSKAKARVNAARENGKRGGRPPNNPAITQPVSSGLDLGTPAETQVKVLHLPSNHLPIEETSSTKSTPAPACPYEKIVQMYHEELPGLPRVVVDSEERKRKIKSFWIWALSSKKSDGTPRAANPQQALDWIRSYFVRASENDFLMGRTPRSVDHRNWKCDLEYLMTDRGRRQVIEKTMEAA